MSRVVTDPDPSLGGVPKQPNLEADGAVMMGFGPVPEVGPRKLLGVSVTADGAIVVDTSGGGGFPAVDTVDLAATPGEIPAASGPNTLAASSFLWGYNAFGSFPDGWYRLAVSPITADMAAAVVTGIGLFQWGGTGNTSADITAGGQPAFEVQAWLTAKERDTSRIRPVRAGYVGALSDAGATLSAPNVIASGGFNTAAPTVTDGTAAALQVDAAANLLTQTGRPQVGTRATAAYLNEYAGVGVFAQLVKATAGNVLAVDVSSADAAAFWFMLFNSSIAPVGGDFPIFRRRLPIGGTVQVGREFFGEAGVSFGNGIGWALSTTGTNLTLPVAADVAVHLSYV